MAKEIISGKWISRNWRICKDNNNKISDDIGKRISDRGGLLLDIGTGPGGGYMPYILKNNPDTALYNQYKGTMLYIVNSILHDIHLAEDAVSEAFIRIMNNLEKIDAVNCYRTRGFVVIIVRNIALDMLRIQKRHQTVPIEDYSDSIGYEEPDFHNITANEACAMITNSISKLHKTYSDILYLKMEFDCSNEELSKILGISQENVKTRLCGFKETSTQSYGNTIMTIYSDDAENKVMFKQRPADTGTILIDNENMEYKEFDIKGNIAYLFESKTKGDYNVLVWQSEEIAFEITSQISSDEIINIANNIKIIRKF